MEKASRSVIAETGAAKHVRASRAEAIRRRLGTACVYFTLLFALGMLGWLIRGAYPLSIMFFSALLAVIVSWVAAMDRHGFIVPDGATLALALTGFAATWLIDPGRLLPHALAVLGAGVLLLAVAAGYRHWRGADGLGLGDVKFFAASGAWLGAEGLPGALLIGSLVAIAVILVRRLRGGRRFLRRRIPFAPYLAIGIWVIWIFGPLRFGG